MRRTHTLLVPSAGQIVILNGPSRVGKSSIAQAMQERLHGIWMNVGMDMHVTVTPPAYRPGVGLRPQRATPDSGEPERVSVGELEDVVPTLYAALYESIAAHARLGLNVVADVYHHDFYTRPLGIFQRCIQRLQGLPVLFVGVHCPIDVIWQRRKATWGQERDTVDDRTREAVELGQVAARAHAYDLEFDTSTTTPEEIADAIGERLERGPPGTAFA